MADPGQEWSDERFDIAIGNILRWGVTLSAAVVLLGGILYLLRNGAQAPDYRTFHGEPTHLRGVAGVLEDASRLSARGVIQLGLLLLIATPAARVLFSLIAFVLQRDRVYVVVTLIVLAAVLYGLAGGHL